MIDFPNCKINIGLSVVNKRTDGFHSLQTVFYPVNWCDALEIIPKNDLTGTLNFSTSGLPIAGDVEGNILYKTWQLFKSKGFNLPSCDLHLHKNIPMGAGLGGGSANAAFLIQMLDKKFDLNLTVTEKINFANTLGSDCAFFIKNSPVFAEGRGNEFSDLHLDLSKYHLLTVYPQIHVNTKEAFAGIIPKQLETNLREIIELSSIKDWRHIIKNDFEAPIFKKHPQISQLKEDLYSAGALYASMSGSGSAVYGIFDKEPSIVFNSKYRFYLQKPNV